MTKVPAIPVLAALNPAPELFGRVNIKTLEEGTPKDKYSLALDWTLGKFQATARVVRYGDVLSPGATVPTDTLLKAATVVDLEGRWSFTDNLTGSIGADNVFDEYTTPYPFALNSTGNVPFSGYSPFGNSGRFVYAKLRYSF